MSFALRVESKSPRSCENGAIHIIAAIVLVFTLIEIIALLDFFEKTDETSPDSIPSKLVEMERRIEELERRRDEDVEKVRVYEIQRSLGYEFDLLRLIRTFKELPSDEQDRLRVSLGKSLFLQKGMSLEDILLRAARSRPSERTASAKVSTGADTNQTVAGGVVE